MPHTKRLKLFYFNELSETAKKKAVAKFYDVNVDDDWWDSVYEYFSMLCLSVGIEVDQEKTYFSGFSSQGDGAAFTADIDLFKLIEGIKEKKYLEHAPNIHEEIISFAPSQCPVDRRVLDLIKRNIIDINVDAEPQSRSNRTKLNFDSGYTHNECVNYKWIDAELEKLEEWIQDALDEFTNALYRLLNNDYDYLTSEEAIIDTILSNEYEFTKDGQKF